MRRVLALVCILGGLAGAGLMGAGLMGCGGDAAVAPANAGEDQPGVEVLAFSPLPGSLQPIPPRGEANKVVDELLARPNVFTSELTLYYPNDDGSIRVRHRGVRPVATTSLSTGLDTLIEMRLIEDPATNTLFIVAAGIKDNPGAAPTGALAVLVDSNADGFIWTDDAVTLISDDAPDPTHGSSWCSLFLPGDGSVLVYDWRRILIRRVFDGNADGIPDSLQVAPFLDTTQSHELSDIRVMIAGPGANEVILRPSGRSLPGDTEYCVRDTNSDGVADEFQTTVIPLWPAGMPPAFASIVDSDDLQVDLAGPEGAVLELLETDAQGVVISVLASATVPTGATRVTVTLLTPRALGSYLACRVQGASTTGPVEQVTSPTPKVSSVTPTELTSSGSFQVTVTGSGLVPSLVVRLNDPQIGTGLDPVTVTLTGNATRMTGTVPDLSSEWGFWTLEVLDGPQGVHQLYCRRLWVPKPE